MSLDEETMNEKEERTSRAGDEQDTEITRLEITAKELESVVIAVKEKQRVQKPCKHNTNNVANIALVFIEIERETMLIFSLLPYF